MSNFQHKENTGSLFINEKREKDTQPNMKGSGLIDGVEYWISAWTNTTNTGDRWQKVIFEPKEEVHNKGMASATGALAPPAPSTTLSETTIDDIPEFTKFADDDIPF